MVRDHGLEIVAFQPFRDFEGMPEPQRSRGFERAKRKFAADERARGAGGSSSAPTSRRSRSAASTGRRRTCASSPRSPTASASRSASRRWPGAGTSRDYRDAWEVVRRADHPPARDHPRQLPHPVPRPAGATRSAPIPADRITFVQLADAPRMDDGHPAMVAALPQLPRPGRPAGRRLHGARSRPPATTAGSATRSSTTASAWPRRGGSPRTASGR